MPDFDIDFCQDNAGGEVIRLRARKNTAATTVSPDRHVRHAEGAKAVVRDAGRVLQMRYWPGRRPVPSWCPTIRPIPGRWSDR
ncbi:hypothetical protein [Sphingobium yanoikuyae]|uniref:hypothetical protein n=1 Tax=Sphingobium yanoikuyae TaxID=13690 RepID=UPI00345F0837